MGGDISRGRRFLKNNKGVVTLAGAVVGGALMGALELDSFAIESIQTNAFVLGYGTLAGAGITRSLVSLASYFRHPVKDFPKIVRVGLAGFFGPSKAADVPRHRRLEAKLKDIYIEGEYLKSVAELDLLEGKIESAFDKYEEVIAIMQEPFDTGIFHRAGLSLAESVHRMQHRKEEPYKLAIQFALRWQYDGFYDNAMRYWQEALGHLPKDIDMNILYGRALESMGKKDIAMDQWKRVLKLVRAEAKERGDISLEQIGDAEVYKLNESDVLENVFVIKVSDDRQLLEDELRTTHEAHEVLGSWIASEGIYDNFAIARSISTTKNGKYSLVSLYERGRTLLEHVEDTKDMCALESAVRFLAAIHSMMRNDAEPREERLHFRQRLDEAKAMLAAEGRPSGDYDPAFSMLLDACKTPIDAIWDSPAVFDKDAHGKNWNISPEGRITAIDFQLKGAVRPEDDLSKLLEIGCYFKNDAVGDLARESMIEVYHGQMSSFGSVPIPPVDEFKFRKLNADLIRTVSYFCASYESTLNRKIRRAYLRNALHSANRLQDEYVGTIDSTDVKQYSLFRRGIESLLEIEEGVRT